jgi:hypothetical protein
MPELHATRVRAMRQFRQIFSRVCFCCAAVDRVLANRAISTGLGGRSDTLGIAQFPCYSRV